MRDDDPPGDCTLQEEARVHLPWSRESFTAEALLVPVQGEQRGQGCTMPKPLLQPSCMISICKLQMAETSSARKPPCQMCFILL